MLGRRKHDARSVQCDGLRTTVASLEPHGALSVDSCEYMALGWSIFNGAALVAGTPCLQVEWLGRRHRSRSVPSWHARYSCTHGSEALPSGWIYSGGLLIVLTVRILLGPTAQRSAAPGAPGMSGAFSAAVQIGRRRPGCRSTTCFLIGKKMPRAQRRRCAQDRTRSHSHSVHVQASDRPTDQLSDRELPPMAATVRTARGSNPVALYFTS